MILRMDFLNKTNHKKNESIGTPDYIKIKYFSSRKVTINKLKYKLYTRRKYVQQVLFKNKNRIKCPKYIKNSYKAKQKVTRKMDTSYAQMINRREYLSEFTYEKVLILPSNEENAK